MKADNTQYNVDMFLSAERSKVKIKCVEIIEEKAARATLVFMYYLNIIK
jgi:hypothetical protein